MSDTRTGAELSGHILNAAPHPTPRSGNSVAANVGATPATIDDELMQRAQTGLALRLSRGQSVAIASAPPDTLYVVRAGVAAIDVRITDRPRQLIALLTPGDAVTASALPTGLDCHLTALNFTDIRRLPWPQSAPRQDLADTSVQSTRVIPAAFNDAVQARLNALGTHVMMRSVMLSALSGPERVATLVLMCALRLGQKLANQISFEMPLSRADIADYTALNPDTVSRIMVRLEDDGVIHRNGRHKYIIPNVEAMLTLCPIVPALSACREVSTTKHNGREA